MRVRVHDAVEVLVRVAMIRNPVGRDGIAHAASFAGMGTSPSVAPDQEVPDGNDEAQIQPRCR
jgi:hypothetical protein